MSKEYLQAIQKKEKYKKENQIYLKNRVFKTFKNLIKTFYNTELKKNQSLLDLGSADGVFVNVSKKEGLDAYGLDAHDLDLEDDKIDFSDNRFDIVTAISLIEHVKNPNNLLKETMRVLKKDGIFILVTPDWSYNVQNFYDDPTHVKPYTKKSLKFLLESFNFKEVYVVPWLVCKPSWMWKTPFSFLIARNLPFRGNRNKFIPEFLKGKSKTLLAICKK
tara:strand:- start:43 stop:699 length:657 start_codon:yes stop_codon:yes gene_type:complete